MVENLPQSKECWETEAWPRGEMCDSSELIGACVGLSKEGKRCVTHQNYVELVLVYLRKGRTGLTLGTTLPPSGEGLGRIWNSSIKRVPARRGPQAPPPTTGTY